jgi:DNA-directed RNA polymerase specialized sigma24 family protein
VGWDLARRLTGTVEGFLGGTPHARFWDGWRQEVNRARALAALPARQRAAVVLVEMLGFDAASAAQILGIKEGTIRSLASQARASLRKTLEEDGD